MSEEFFIELFNKKSKQTSATPIVSLMREFKSLDTFMGAEYDVFDETGKKIYTIKKRPITLPQMNALIEELTIILKEEEKQMKKSSKKK